MKPIINDCSFGYVNVGDSTIDHDIIIRLSGEIKKRKKKLSKAIYGTSHIISIDEVKHIYQKGAELLIIGSGHQGMVKLSNGAAEYLEKRNCRIKKYKTPKAIIKWNRAKGQVIGLFHLTC